MKRNFILTVLLAIATMGAAQVTCWDGTVAEAYAVGDGTLENPYQIATAEQLALLAQETNESPGRQHQLLCFDCRPLHEWLQRYAVDSHWYRVRKFRQISSPLTAPQKNLL